MDLKYIGDEDIVIVKVETYRDDPRLSSDFELFTVEEKELELRPAFQHQNFPLSAQATKLKGIVNWTKEDKDSPNTEKNLSLINRKHSRNPP